MFYEMMQAFGNYMTEIIVNVAQTIWQWCLIQSDGKPMTALFLLGLLSVVAEGMLNQLIGRSKKRKK